MPWLEYFGFLAFLAALLYALDRLKPRWLLRFRAWNQRIVNKWPPFDLVGSAVWMAVVLGVMAVAIDVLHIFPGLGLPKFWPTLVAVYVVQLFAQAASRVSKPPPEPQDWLTWNLSDPPAKP